MFKNSRQAYQIYRKLSDEEKEILRNKKISGRHSLREWNRKLGHIALMDSYADKARQGLVLIMVLCAFPAFFALMGVINAPGFISFFFLLLLLALFGMALYLYLTFKKIDVGNQLRFFIIPTLRLLSRKVRKSHKIELDIDLATANDRNYQVNQEIDQHPADRRFRKVTYTDYRIPWLRAKVPLADGSLLMWENVDLVRERKVVKRPKGKVKTKYKIKHLAKVQLLLPKARYDLAVENSEAIGIEEAPQFYRLNIKGKERSNRNPNQHGEEYKSMNPRYFTSLLVKAYEQVTPKSITT